MAAAGGLSTLLALCLRDKRNSAVQRFPATGLGDPHRAELQARRRLLRHLRTALLRDGSRTRRLGAHLCPSAPLPALRGAPLAASCFWLSLLVGRAIAPAVLLRVREELLLGVALICAFVGVAALLTLHSLPAVMLSAALAGFSMAPIFPICVAIFMALTRDPGATRWMFAVAGLGSATLPWATGQLCRAHRLAAHRAACPAPRSGPHAGHDALAGRRHRSLPHHLSFAAKSSPLPPRRSTMFLPSLVTPSAQHGRIVVNAAGRHGLSRRTDIPGRVAWRA